MDEMLVYKIYENVLYQRPEIQNLFIEAERRTKKSWKEQGLEEDCREQYFQLFQEEEESVREELFKLGLQNGIRLILESLSLNDTISE